jgi:cyclopropane fatty-acyl-phospholipid synthase-like methyltransferase
MGSNAAGEGRILADVAAYYSGKLAQHGATARGVDWNSEDSQRLRFDQLARVFEGARGTFTVLDYGCGVGALVPYLSERFPAFELTGFDVAEEMVATARSLHGAPRVHFTTSIDDSERFDYVVASGIFNVRMHHEAAAWRTYIEDTLERFHRLSVRGFAFNILTSYSDPEYMRQDLYYGDPRELFDLCVRRFSRRVAVLHDYPLYEFTIIVRKDR